MHKYISLIILFFCVGNIFSSEVQEFRGGKTRIGEHLSYLKTDEWNDVDAIIDQLESFKPSNKKTLNFKTINKVVWIYFELENVSSHEDLLLQIRMPLIDSMKLYKISPKNDIIWKKVSYEHQFKNREVDHQFHHFALDLGAKQKAKYLMAVKSQENMILPMRIGTTDQIRASLNVFDNFFFLFVGVMIALLLYNFFIYLSIRDTNYMMYVCYILVLLITQTNRHGFTTYYFWPEIDWLPNFVISQLAPSMVLVIIPFAYGFLQINHKPSIWNIGSLLLVISCIIAIVLGWFRIYGISRNIALFGTLFGAFWLFGKALELVVKKQRQAYFFLTGWVFFMCAGIYFLLSVNGVFTFTIFSEQAPLIGAMFEGVLLSFALGDRINTINKEKEVSRKQVLEAHKKYQQVLAAQNQKLEKEVALRTKELNIANMELKRQALSAQMNPHFIFNVLNSIQNYMLKKETDKADKYLAKFARLTRFVLDSSIQKEVLLSDELKVLNGYLALEKLRFGEVLTYEIQNKCGMDDSTILIPSMVILPFLENAVWHGIMHKKGTGMIQVILDKKGEELHCLIQDNGVGYDLTKKRKNHKSTGMRITLERLKLHCEFYKKPYFFNIKNVNEITPDCTGTIVEFYVPYKMLEV